MGMAGRGLYDYDVMIIVTEHISHLGWNTVQ